MVRVPLLNSLLVLYRKVLHTFLCDPDFDGHVILDQAKETSLDTLQLRVECTFFGRSGKEAWLMPEEQSFCQSFGHRLLSAEKYWLKVVQRNDPCNAEAGRHTWGRSIKFEIPRLCNSLMNAKFLLLSPSWKSLAIASPGMTFSPIFERETRGSF